MNRELAIECIKTQRQFVDNETRKAFDWAIYLLEKQSALDEWCTDCKEYDQEKHCCPRWNRVIREALKDAQPERKKGKWIPVMNGRGGHCCNRCNGYAPSYKNGDEHLSDFCPNCGADMRGEQDE